MKIIALFLTLVVFTLTLMPCCVIARADAEAGVTSVKEKRQCDEQSAECTNGCSPFYVCGGCMGFVFPIQQALTFALPLSPVQHNTVYLPLALPAPSLSFWQPPKLA